MLMPLERLQPLFHKYPFTIPAREHLNIAMRNLWAKSRWTYTR